jgi:hypothetical protein
MLYRCCFLDAHDTIDAIEEIEADTLLGAIEWFASWPDGIAAGRLALGVTGRTLSNSRGNPGMRQCGLRPHLIHLIRGWGLTYIEIGVSSCNQLVLANDRRRSG